MQPLSPAAHPLHHAYSHEQRMHVSLDVKGLTADAGHECCSNRNTEHLSARGFFAVQHTSSMGCVFTRAGGTALSPQPTLALLPAVWHGRSPRAFAPRFVPLLGAMWAQIGFSSPSAPFSQHCPTGQTSFRMTGAASTLLGFPHLIAPTSFSPARCLVIPVLSFPFALISPGS